MEPFLRHTGDVLPVDRAHVDTDQIVPKQFLKRIERTGYGAFLFYNWRYRPDGTPDPSCLLNDPAYAKASILLARENFGSGSSREHAVWAIRDYGFRAVIAPSFADIFYTNAVKNGLLPVRLSPREVEELFRLARRGRLTLTVDLVAQEVRVVRVGDEVPREPRSFSFAISPVEKDRLTSGLDDIALTERHLAAIERFERERDVYRNFAYPTPPVS
ncbi:MAG: 3-isopropylmalate dehydratase small subunit [Brockia lithotrophica]|uniref:3-isopropylmalate dehydratase small subunit n=1 Tax=Brockia lithotrophica TaxID=933949 RepID=A0A2T5G4J1_9BACL|nr:MAG: 3-isopropylmalate dehydratase small subunit [Brockia lithotrophica]